jgi:hypothetical protein
MAVVHDRKEIENFLLVPEAIDRAAATKLQVRARREGMAAEPSSIARASLETFAAASRNYVFSQRLAAAKRFDRDQKKGTHEEIINERELEQLEASWRDPERRLRMIGGKDAFSRVSKDIQEEFGISITSAAVIDAMRVDDIPADMLALVRALDAFARGDVPGTAED